MDGREEGEERFKQQKHDADYPVESTRKYTCIMITHACCVHET